MYRHPALVATIASTIDHVSDGRFELGMGATWHDGAHEQYGMPLPALRVRMEMLDEACRIIKALWAQETTTFEGRHYQLLDARLEPKPVQERLPLIVGGGEERRLLRIVAEHADVWNTAPAGVDAYRHKVEVLAGHCHDVGRDPGSLRRSMLYRAVLATTEAEAEQRFDALLPADSPARAATFCGTPEQCADHLRQYLELGIGDVLLNVRPPLDWETIELVANQVAPALRA